MRVPRPHPLLRFAPVLLLAALAACDQRPTEPSAAAPSGVAPLLSVADAVPGRYVVVLRDGVAPSSASTLARQTVAASGGTLHYTYGRALTGFAATLPAAAVEALRRNPQVKYVAQDAWTFPTQLAPQATQSPATWGIDRIDQRSLPLGGTYVYNRTGAGVRVYVIDSGILTTHTDFGGRASVGTDFVADGQNGQDCNGHGTHVAGTIAGTTWGVAKAAQVVSVRVFGCSGGAEYSTVIAAVDWVTANAVKPAVANMSLGGGVYTPMNEAVQASIASGVLYAVAAGNESSDACQRSPASTPEALTVAASEMGDSRTTWYSNYGPCVDLFAPGTDITSAWWLSTTATNTISGTSMASPHVAGVAALYLQGAPAATPATVAAAILNTSSFGRLSNIGEGSPNRLLYSGLTAEPPFSFINLSTTEVSFTFVRAVAGAAVGAAPLPEGTPRPVFRSSGLDEARVRPASAGGVEAATSTASVLSRPVILSNGGNTRLNWGAASNRPWLTSTPADGALSAGYEVVLNPTVNDAALAPGIHTGALTLSGASNSPVALNVTVNVTNGEILPLGVPLTGLSGDYGSYRYFAVTVPTGAPSLTISTSGGTGDADLRVRYGEVPTWSDFDCASSGGNNSETCTTDLPRAGTYWVMLYGFNAYSGLTLSAAASGPPTAPWSVGGRAYTPTAIGVTWADGSVNETDFSVSRRSMPPGGIYGAWAHVGTAAANATTFANGGLSAGTTYQYRVRACNVAGCSAWAYGTTITIPTSPPPPPFSLVAVASATSSAVLTWVDGSTTETSFTLVRRLQNVDGTWGAYATVVWPAANATSFTNNGLLPGRSYQYQINACNAHGCSTWAVSNVVTIGTPPAPPGTVTGTVLSGTTIRVNWTDASSNEASFILARAPVSGGGVVGAFVDLATLAPNQVAFTNTGLGVGGQFQYRVRACNLAGCSAWTTSATVAIPPVPAAPTTPAGAALSSSSIRVTWNDASGNETSFGVFRALRNLDGTWGTFQGAGTVAANTTQLDDTGLLAGRTYRYQIRACNVSGCSGWAVSGFVSTPP